MKDHPAVRSPHSPLTVLLYADTPAHTVVGHSGPSGNAVVAQSGDVVPIAVTLEAGRAGQRVNAALPGRLVMIRQSSGAIAKLAGTRLVPGSDAGTAWGDTGGVPEFIVGYIAEEVSGSEELVPVIFHPSHQKVDGLTNS